MTDTSEGECGFSCTFAKKDTYDILQDLLRFSEYDPTTAVGIIDEISVKVDEAKRIIHSRYKYR